MTIVLLLLAFLIGGPAASLLVTYIADWPAFSPGTGDDRQERALFQILRGGGPPPFGGDDRRGVPIKEQIVAQGLGMRRHRLRSSSQMRVVFERAAPVKVDVIVEEVIAPDKTGGGG